MIKITRSEANAIYDAYKEWNFDKATVICSAVSYKIRGIANKDTSITNLCLVFSYLNLVNLVSVLDGNFIIEEEKINE